ncbi:MAG: hypothetical protein JO170_04860 [Verrucomicrobia bacterium]|nr:hypothetical protein [Verrucomicrobiota bacterium]
MHAILLVMPGCLFILMLLIISLHVPTYLTAIFINFLISFLPIVVFLLMLMIFISSELRT